MTSLIYAIALFGLQHGRECHGRGFKSRCRKSYWVSYLKPTYVRFHIFSSVNSSKLFIKVI